MLIWILKPSPSIALGMILVAACPGGNISNFMTHLAGGNNALSVSLTAFATVLAIFFVPFNLELWGGMYPPTATLLKKVAFTSYGYILDHSFLIDCSTNFWDADSILCYAFCIKSSTLF